MGGWVMRSASGALPLLLCILSPSAIANESRLENTVIEPSQTQNVALNAGLGLPILKGDLGWGVAVGAVEQAEPGGPVYVGFDLGLYHWTHGGRGNPRKVLNLQVLPTLCYAFVLPMVPLAIPYLGISMGPSLYFSSGKTTTGSDFQVTQILPAVLLRTGMHLVVTEAIGITLESKLGILQTEFLFVPQVNTIWWL